MTGELEINVSMAGSDGGKGGISVKAMGSAVELLGMVARARIALDEIEKDVIDDIRAEAAER